jgi:hypothetical protein
MMNRVFSATEQRHGPDFGAAVGRDAASVHAQMCALTTWFVRHVAISGDIVIDHHDALGSRPFDDILADLVDMKYGTMCGGLSSFMGRAAKLKGYDAIAMNFGNESGVESHVLVLVATGNGERIFYDPTFGCFSGNRDGAPVSAQTIIDLLRRGKGEDLRWVEIGPRERPVLFRTDTLPQVPVISPIRRIDQLRSMAMCDLRLHGSFAWFGIWQWARAQKPGLRTLFDCLRFPLGTSGEADAEALADQFRSIA